MGIIPKWNKNAVIHILNVLIISVMLSSTNPAKIWPHSFHKSTRTLLAELHIWESTASGAKIKDQVVGQKASEALGQNQLG